MLIGFWISIFVFFWTAYYYIPNGRLTRHLGFFHFLLYFLSIYLGAISVYEDGGSTDLRYLISVLLYPLLALFGMLTASLLKRKAAYPDVEFRYEPRDNRLVVRAFVFFLIFFGVYLYSLGSNIPRS